MKKKFQKTAALLMALLLTLSLLSACGGNDSGKTPDSDPATAVNNENENTQEPNTPAEPETPASDDDVDGELIVDHEEELKYAQCFTMTHYKGGYISFKVLGGDEEAWTYLIIPEGKSVPADLGDDYVILQQPITSVRCCSGSGSAISSFGGLDRVTSMSMKADSVAIPALQEAFANGSLVYTGGYKEPEYETILDLNTQLVIDTGMASGAEDAKAKLIELGIPYLAPRNAKEVHPLGYNEWAKVYGAILGMLDEATAYFEECVEQVEALAGMENTGKSVLMMYCSSDGTKVYVPRGGDSWGCLVELAGGVNAAKDYEAGETGTGTIGDEEFYAMFKDADYLFNMNMAAKLWTLDELLEHEPLLKDFKAVQEDHAYICIDRIYQFNYDFAGMIADMNQILTDDTVNETTYFYRATTPPASAE